jgi:hypothetical protein
LPRSLTPRRYLTGLPRPLSPSRAERSVKTTLDFSSLPI